MPALDRDDMRSVFLIIAGAIGLSILLDACGVAAFSAGIF